MKNVRQIYGITWGKTVVSLFSCVILLVYGCSNGPTVSSPEDKKESLPSDKVVNESSTVTFHYTGMVANDQVFVTTRGHDPVTCKVGQCKVISFVGKELIGMRKGETKRFVVSPEQGYGKRDESLIKRFPEEFLQNSEVKIGEMVQVKGPEGKLLFARLLAKESGFVVMDFNHPLAGLTLTFTIEVLDVK